MKKSSVILIGICVVASLVLAWAVFVKPEPAPPIPPPPPPVNGDTSDWKTYQNEEFGFEIKYPSTLYFFDCSERFREPNPLYVHFTPYVKDNCNAPGKAMMSVISISTVKDFEKNKIINLLDKNIKEKNITVGNKSAIQISGDREVVGDEGEKSSSPPIREIVCTNVPFEKNTSIQISYSRIASVENNTSGFYVGEDLSKIYNQILSTFKFINQ